MRSERRGQTAVIFLSQRTGDDEAGYAAAAAAMSALAATQPGYRGEESVRDAGGSGITISYWADDATAAAWRDHPEHQQIRETGRGRWYAHYEVCVTSVTRDYRWVKA